MGIDIEYTQHKNQLLEKSKNKKTRTKKQNTKKIKSKTKAKTKKVAQAQLKQNKREEYQVSLNVDGSTSYIAGGIIELDKTFGKFEGKYIIDKVTHNISEDYSCDLELLRLEGVE